MMTTAAVLTLLQLLMPSQLPEGFSYDRQSRAISVRVEEETAQDSRFRRISAESCTDLGLFRKKTDEVQYAVLSHCPASAREDAENSRAFRVTQIENGREQSLLQYIRETSISVERVRIFELGSGAVFLSLQADGSNSRRQLYYLNSRSVLPLRHFLYYGALHLFDYKDSWYFINTEVSDFSQIVLKSALYKMVSPPGASLENVKLFSPTENSAYLLVEFRRTGDVEPALYSFNRNQWLLLPGQTLSEKEKSLISEGNLLLRLLSPEPDSAEDTRIYYKIYVDGRLHGKTGFNDMGTVANYIINVKPGIHTVKIVRYVTHKNNEGNLEYRRDNNLNQPDSLRIQVTDSAKYLIYLRRGTDNDSKPYVLESSRLQPGE